MTVLVDASAWIEFLRATGSSQHAAVREAVRDGVAATSDVVILELLVGPMTEAESVVLARLLDTCHYLPQLARVDVESAAALYRGCRRAGETPRSVNDCLVAAVAIRNAVTVLHRDRDFDLIARHTPLQIASD